MPYVISIGEDGNICLWSVNGTLLYRKTVPTNLWNLDYDPINQRIFVCGGDGNIRQLCIQQILKSQHIQITELAIDNMNTKEYIAKIKIIDGGTLVGLTNQNRLTWCQGTEIIMNNWKRQPDPLNYKSSLLESYKSFIATAGHKICSVYQYDVATNELNILFEETFPLKIIRSFHFLSDNEYIICDDEGNLALIHRATCQIYYFTMPMSKERWATIAHKYENFLLIGDRCGNLHLFQLEIFTIKFCFTLKHVHGHLGCTTITQLANDGLFQTTGHDGTMKTINLNVEQKTLLIYLTKKCSIAWIDKVLATAGLMCGFNDNYFVVWDERQQDIIFEVECGGGHRYWDFYVNHSNYFEFLYIRNKSMHKIEWSAISATDDRTLIIPKSNWHSKSCNHVICLPWDRCKENVLLISGGDDNLLKFSQFIQKSNQINHIEDMVQHVSNIRSICVMRIESNKWFVFSAGGRAQICVTEVNVQSDTDIQLKEITNFMLNLNDFERRRQGKSNIVDFDPETRFMCSTIVTDNNIEPIRLVIGCSDGYIRQFKFVETTIQLVNSIFYGKCILNIIHFNEILLTMATDGLICFWNMKNFESNLKPFYKLHHHNSGINSFDLFDSNGKYFIATGGDDQSIVISVFQINDLLQVTIDRHLVLNNCHTAQVNGVHFNKKMFCLFTTGVDQTVFKTKLDTFETEFVAMSCVADIKGMRLIGNGTDENDELIQILVYGNGVQMLQINNKKEQ